MSIDSAKAYVERMKADEEFRKKVLACKDPKKRMELVKASGFDFTEKDIKVVTAGIDDRELGSVVGGHSGLCVIFQHDVDPCPADGANWEDVKK